MVDRQAIGELVLNPFLGPRFKTPGHHYRSAHGGRCAIECPCSAISFGDKIMFDCYEMWKPDVEKRTLYRVTNQKGASCGRCMKMCPFYKEGLVRHRLGLWLAIHAPPLPVRPAPKDGDSAAVSVAGLPCVPCDAIFRLSQNRTGKWEIAPWRPG